MALKGHYSAYNVVFKKQVFPNAICSNMGVCRDHYIKRSKPERQRSHGISTYMWNLKYNKALPQAQWLSLHTSIPGGKRSILVGAKILQEVDKIQHNESAHETETGSQT